MITTRASSSSSISDGDSLTTVLLDILLPLKRHKDTVSQRFLQSRENTCGPAALAYILNFYGLETDEDDILKHVHISSYGTSMLQLKNAAKDFGFIGKGYKSNYKWLKQQALPLIAHVNDKHYVVINKIINNRIYLFDPLEGHIILEKNDFENLWSGNVLTVRPEPIQRSL